MLDIFSIPEVTDLIARHASLQDMAKCIRVCRHWHSVFLPPLWAAFDVSQFFDRRPRVVAPPTGPTRLSYVRSSRYRPIAAKSGPRSAAVHAEAHNKALNRWDNPCVRLAREYTTKGAHLRPTPESAKATFAEAVTSLGKHGHLLRWIRVSSLEALRFIGPTCTRLTVLDFGRRNDPPGHGRYNMGLIVSNVLERNPWIRSLRITILEEDARDSLERITRAICCHLHRLQELSLSYGGPHSRGRIANTGLRRRRRTHSAGTMLGSTSVMTGRTGGSPPVHIERILHTILDHCPQLVRVKFTLTQVCAEDDEYEQDAYYSDRSDHSEQSDQSDGCDAIGSGSSLEPSPPTRSHSGSPATYWTNLPRQAGSHAGHQGRERWINSPEANVEEEEEEGREEREVDHRDENLCGSDLDEQLAFDQGGLGWPARASRPHGEVCGIEHLELRGWWPVSTLVSVARRCPRLRFLGTPYGYMDTSHIDSILDVSRTCPLLEGLDLDESTFEHPSSLEAFIASVGRLTHVSIPSSHAVASLRAVLTHHTTTLESIRIYSAGTGMEDAATCAQSKDLVLQILHQCPNLVSFKSHVPIDVHAFLEQSLERTPRLLGTRLVSLELALTTTLGKSPLHPDPTLKQLLLLQDATMARIRLELPSLQTLVIVGQQGCIMSSGHDSLPIDVQRAVVQLRPLRRLQRIVIYGREYLRTGPWK